MPLPLIPRGEGPPTITGQRIECVGEEVERRARSDSGRSSFLDNSGESVSASSR